MGWRVKFQDVKFGVELIDGIGIWVLPAGASIYLHKREVSDAITGRMVWKVLGSMGLTRHGDGSGGWMVEQSK